LATITTGLGLSQSRNLTVDDDAADDYDDDLRLDLLSGIVVRDFCPNSFEFIFSLMQIICSARILLFDLIIQTIFREEFKL
jgi:hypothetical protein